MNSWRDIPNPWKELPLTEQSDFYLPNEKNDNYSQTIPPQPYQGTPDAKIWILLANPGFKDKDDITEDMESDIDFFKQHKDRVLKQLIFEQTGNGGYYNYIAPIERSAKLRESSERRDYEHEKTMDRQGKARDSA